jgi:serine protease Do
MRTFGKHISWVLAVVGVTCLALSWSDSFPRREVTAAPSAADARQLSSVFRAAAREVIPSIVSIETRGKVEQMDGLDLDDENFPFGELFRQSPQFREFFRDRPRQREMPRSRGMGSGFIIDETGIILTNSHVVRGADEVKVRLHNGQEFTATDIKMDDNSDVAIMRIKDAKNLKALRFGDSDTAEIGDWVLAVGNPFDVGVTVTAGIISAKSRGLGIARREDFLQTDAAINPGNSGGPLVNLNGEVIGINTAISSRSGGSEGIGFAIPVNMAKWVSQQLIQFGKVRRAYLGIQIQPLTTALARSLRLQGIEGLLISRVTKDSPAAEAKLVEGDVILQLNGQKVDSAHRLQSIVERLEIGKTYKALIIRDGKQIEVPVTMREMPENFLAGGAFEEGRNGRRRGPNAPSATEDFNELGIQVRDLTPETAKELGFGAAVSGVVITKIDPNGLAAKAGISPGLLIEKVGTKKISSLKDFEEAVKAGSIKEGIALLVASPTGKFYVVLQSDKD